MKIEEQDRLRVEQNGVCAWQCPTCRAIATTESNAFPPRCGICACVMGGIGWVKIKIEAENHGPSSDHPAGPDDPTNPSFPRLVK